MARTSWLFVVALVFATASWASTPVTLMWKKVSFETDSGDSVLLEVRDEILTRASLTIDGRRVPISTALLNDIRLPVLSRADLIYSSGMVHGKLVKHVALDIPVLDPTLEVQDPNPVRRYRLVVRDGHLIQRLLQEREGMNWETVEVKNLAVEK